jgi:hypothetical protein
MYEPFPIYDFKTGKFTARDPWLSPADAFSTLRNGHVKYGILEKRRGYTEFGQLVGVNTATKVPTLSTNPIMGITYHTESGVDTLLIMDQDRINKYESSISTGISITAFADAGGGEVTVTAASHGFETDDIVTISGTTNYNGTFSVTKVDANNFKITDTWVSDDATGIADQEQFVDLTRNKIRYKGKVGQNWTPAATDVVEGGTSGATGTVKSNILDVGSVANDNAAGTIVFTNGSVSGTFQNGEELQESGTPANIAGDAVGANTDDIFTGDNTQFFTFAKWKGVTYFTNNNDVIQKYEGTDLTRLHIDLGVETGPDNDVTRCRYIVLARSRLVIFDTTESGVTYDTRARWCDIDDPDTWPANNYVDCPIEDQMSGIGFLGNDLVVFFRNHVRRFVYTHDEDLPFVWEKIDGFEGSRASKSIIEMHDELYGLSKTNVIGTDGRRSYKIDLANPEFVPTWIQASIPYSFGYVWKDLHQAWLSYTSDSASANADGNKYADSVLVLDTEDKNWATYSIPVHCMGITDLEDDLTWNDVTDAWEDIDWSWNDAGIQAESDVPLFGSQDGKVYRINNTLADDGSAIPFNALSARLNPYVKKGHMARLGFMEFMCDVDADSSFTVKFFVDSDTSSFDSQVITCEAVDSADDKVWHRADVNAVGRFHRFKITDETAGSRPRIHCITLWFEKAGPII